MTPRESERLGRTILKLKRAARILAKREPETYGFVDAGFHYLTGWCYLFAEVIFFAHPDLGLKPRHLKREDGGVPPDSVFLTHWYLVTPEGVRIDPTAAQFSATPKYELARHRPFRTKKPSKRAIVLAEAARVAFPLCPNSNTTKSNQAPRRSKRSTSSSSAAGK